MEDDVKYGWRDWRTWALTFLVLLVGAAAITRQSLWMDEGSSVFKALMPTLGDWWKATLQLRGSDVQMPVYMVSLWFWVKLGALSEFALRCVNLPWFVLGALALRHVRFWPLVYLTSPFVLYYVGELRPYAMQIAAGALAAGALGKLMRTRDEDDFDGLGQLGCAAFLLVCSSLTAAVWAAGLGLALVVLRPAWLVRRGFWLRSMPWILGGLLLGAYYVFTLLEGYRATGFAGVGLMSVGFGFYELIGLLGLGPGKNELRTDLSALLPYVVVLVPAFGFIVAAWTMGALTWIRGASRRDVAAVAVAVGFPILVLCAVGLLQDFRVLGRHFSPVIPAVLLPVAVALGAVGPKRIRSVVVGGLAVCVMILSSLGVRLLERHARDDCRRASERLFAEMGTDKTIMWNADMNSLRYYAFRRGGFPLVQAVQVLESEKPSSLFMADVVILNRPEISFQGQDHEEVLRRNDFEKVDSFTGFEVWKLNY